MGAKCPHSSRAPAGPKPHAVTPKTNSTPPHHSAATDSPWAPPLHRGSETHLGLPSSSSNRSAICPQPPAARAPGRQLTSHSTTDSLTWLRSATPRSQQAEPFLTQPIPPSRLQHGVCAMLTRFNTSPDQFSSSFRPSGYEPKTAFPEPRCQQSPGAHLLSVV